MTRFLLAIAFIASTACGWTPPQGGAPTLPDGAHTIALKQLSLLGPNDIGPAIAASTSLSQVREAVTAHFGKARPGTPIPWSEVTDQPGQVYVAVLTNPECTRPVKEATALGDHTLLFLHWIGHSDGVCNAAMARPSWRLYSVARSYLPKSGTFTVRLEFQGDAGDVVETQVPLS